MKFVSDRPFADPEVAARKLLEIAHRVQAVQDGRIHIEKINWPFLTDPAIRGTPSEYKAALEFAVAKGWFWRPPQQVRDLLLTIAATQAALITWLRPSCGNKSQ
ncbi:hypothetical protein [Bradyrhizobium sp. STM 3562]|uniref:hypothetical protein n=1 Tax=Bradyrhizobium sp. STM 3562 TaxID=578924 RepID=UPI00388FB1A5